jgi:hypothetical protein
LACARRRSHEHTARTPPPPPAAGDKIPPLPRDPSTVTRIEGSKPNPRVAASRPEPDARTAAHAHRGSFPVCCDSVTARPWDSSEATCRLGVSHTQCRQLAKLAPLKDQMATREGGVNRSRQKFFPKNPAYTLIKPRSHTSDGSNHTPIAKTTRLWINL